MIRGGKHSKVEKVVDKTQNNNNRLGKKSGKC